MLQRSGSSKKNAHVVWDEENLSENAEIQKEYSQVRISEPKTPYHAPVPVADEEDQDMKPLDLDQETAATSRAAVMTAFDFVMSNGGAAYSPPGPSRRRAASSSAASADDEPADGALGNNKRNEPCNSFTSSGSEGPGGDPGSADKRRRFQEMRKQHYNMRQALEKAKQLASEDEEADEEADTAGWHVGAAERSHEQADAEAAGAVGSTSQGAQSSDADMLGAAAAHNQQVQPPPPLNQQQQRQEQQQQQLDGGMET